ncbi:hypothetical protein AAVH_43258 [Aphelenchoides avenae]|nr:hypothetical protein AAVH_43258 [Aphelenchus avenae]
MGGLDFGARNVVDEDEEIDVVTCDDREVAPTPLPSLSTLLPAHAAAEQQRELSPPLKLSSNIFEAFAPPPPALEPLEYSVQDNEQTVFKFSTSFGFRSSHSSPAFSSPALLLAGAAQEDAIEEGQDVAASLFDLDDFLPRKVPELDADEEEQALLLDQPVSPPWPTDLHDHHDAASDPLKPAGLFDVVFFMEDPAKPAVDAVAEDNDEDKPPQLFAASPDAGEEGDETDGHFVNGMAGRKRLALGALVGDVAEKRPCCEDDDETGDAIEPKTGTLKTGSADSGIDVEAGLAGEDSALVGRVDHTNDQTVPALTGPVRRIQSMTLVCK